MSDSQQIYTLPLEPTNTPYTIPPSYTVPPGYTLPPQIADVFNTTVESTNGMVATVTTLVAFLALILCICQCLSCGNAYVTRTFPKPRRHSAMTSKPG